MIKILIDSKTHGEKLMVMDSDDLFLISGKSLCVSGDGKYVIASWDGKTEYVHRIIAMVDSEGIVDHSNMNTFDNRKINLRITDYSGNATNREKRKNTRNSKYKGVIYKSDKSRNLRWQVKVGNKSYGHFMTEVEAAIEYNKIAAEKYGAFFRPNRIDPAEIESLKLMKEKTG